MPSAAARRHGRGGPGASEPAGAVGKVAPAAMPLLAAAPVLSTGSTPLGGPNGPSLPDSLLHRLGISPPVHLHQLLTDWQWRFWPADVALALIVAVAAAYLWGVRRLGSRGRRWPARRAVSFGAGLVVMLIAVVSGVASYDTSVFTVHVIQHLLLMMVAPPLLAMGAPVTLALQASSRPTQTRLLRVLHSSPLAVLSMPLVAAALYYSAMYVDLGSSLYRYSVVHPLVHDVSHVVMFSLGYLYWWSILGFDRTSRQLPLPVRVGGLVVGMPFEVFLGIALLSGRSPIAPQHTLSDTHAGGGAFWVLSMLITGAGAGVLLVQWMRQEERRGAREDRRPHDAARPEGDPWAAAWARAGGPPPTVTGWRPPDADAGRA
ncbi:MAG TPA: cytochrome c oxidase assembly protein [Acidimicrobiales bacterium]|nr:cytochrome c oxidase assembly protein [Acidimicrobiales bacterium]